MKKRFGLGVVFPLVFLVFFIILNYSSLNSLNSIEAYRFLILIIILLGLGGYLLGSAIDLYEGKKMVDISINDSKSSKTIKFSKILNYIGVFFSIILIFWVFYGIYMNAENILGIWLLFIGPIVITIVFYVFGRLLDFFSK